MPPCMLHHGYALCKASGSNKHHSPCLRGLRSLSPALLCSAARSSWPSVLRRAMSGDSLLAASGLSTQGDSLFAERDSLSAEWDSRWAVPDQRRQGAWMQGRQQSWWGAAEKTSGRLQSRTSWRWGLLSGLLWPAPPPLPPPAAAAAAAAACFAAFPDSEKPHRQENPGAKGL